MWFLGMFSCVHYRYYSRQFEIVITKKDGTDRRESNSVSGNRMSLCPDRMEISPHLYYSSSGVNASLSLANPDTLTRHNSPSVCPSVCLVFSYSIFFFLLFTCGSTLITPTTFSAHQEVFFFFFFSPPKKISHHSRPLHQSRAGPNMSHG